MLKSELHRRIIDELYKIGAKDVRLVPGGKHPSIEYTLHGRRRKYHTSWSPSDWRAAKKAIADIRRLARAEKKK